MAAASRVSIIVPVYNAESYLPECLQSILEQTYRPLEAVFHDDRSNDGSVALLLEWKPRLEKVGISVIIGMGEENRGPGYSRNRAAERAQGDVLCHLDADDFMAPDRISLQMEVYFSLSEEDRKSALIGTRFDREPLSSTPFYTNWLNSLTTAQLDSQKFRECTIICPTWLYSREVFKRVASRRTQLSDNEYQGGAFVESSPHFLAQSKISRVPEDLIFFLDHCLLGGRLLRCDSGHSPLVTYRYTLGGWSNCSNAIDLQRVRVQYLEEMVLSRWPSLQVWGAGKRARKIFTFLSIATKMKITHFLDVDPAKIGRMHYCRETLRHIPIIHFSSYTNDPILVLVSSKRSLGALEENIQSLGLVEGLNYVHFC